MRGSVASEINFLKKKTAMKKILALVLAVMMMASLFVMTSATAFADDWKFERKIEIVCTIPPCFF